MSLLGKNKVDGLAVLVEAEFKKILEGLKTDPNEQAQSSFDLSIAKASEDVLHAIKHFADILEKNLTESQRAHVFGESHDAVDIRKKTLDALIAKLKPAVKF